MPPRSKITRDGILAGTLSFWQSRPLEEWNARALAKEMGISTQPIFSNFSSMEELKREALKKLGEEFQNRIALEIRNGKWPAYKAVGMAYIQFAAQEPRLFAMLFMRDRRCEGAEEGDPLTENALGLLSRQTGADREEAQRMHLAMWSCTHGIATMLATGFLTLEEEQISQILTDLYQGLLKQKGVAK